MRDELEKLAELRDKGDITKDEFDRLKARIVEGGLGRSTSRKWRHREWQARFFGPGVLLVVLWLTDLFGGGMWWRSARSGDLPRCEDESAMSYVRDVLVDARPVSCSV